MNLIWPNNAPYAYACTFDLDRIRPTYHRFLDGVSADAFWNWNHIATTLEEFGAAATLFVLDQSNPLPHLLAGRIPDAFGVYRLETVAAELRKLRAAGVEIGIHGNWGTSRRADRLLRQRQRLSAAIGEPLEVIVGNRQHYLDHEGDITFAAEAEAGLRYDASVGANHSNGPPHGRTHPYWGRPGLVEIPLTAMDTALVVESKRTKLDPVAIACAARDSIRAVGGVFQICHHPHHFRPGSVSYEVGRVLLEEARRDGAWCATLSDIAARFRKYSDSSHPKVL